MRWRYTRFDAEAQDQERLLRQLRSLFHDLLLQAGGDVERALDFMRQLGERYGFFDRGVSFEEFQRYLEESEEVRAGPQGLELTRKGEQVIRQESLDAVFGALERGGAGDHRVSSPGQGTERLPETRPWSFGDSMSDIDASASVKNALRRAGGAGLETGSGFDISEEDLEVYETEHLSSCATVLLVDISHSMILYGEDRITPAKRVAMALCELIRTRYPKDSLHVVTFGDEAREVPLESLPYVSVGPFHTNTRDALSLARDLLRKQKQPNRQIFMITDGKPSALTESNGEIYKNPFGLDRRIVAKTLDEAAACRRYGIPITTFMLTDDPVLVAFVDEFTQVARGRAYYSGMDRLGSFLFVDFIKNRKRGVR